MATYCVDNSASVSGTVTSGTFIKNEIVVQGTSGAIGQLIGTVISSGPMVITDITGTGDDNHTWTGVTSGAVFTPTSAPVYYGADTNDGSLENPWKTITKVNAAIKHGNDIVAFKRGCVFSDAALSIWTDATAGNEVIYTSYGSNAALPILTSASQITSWSKTLGKTNVYEKTVGAGFVSYGMGNKAGVHEDWADMIGVADIDICDATPGSFYYDGSILYIHTFESDNPALHSIRSMKTAYTARSNNQSNWRIKKLCFMLGQRRGFYIYGTSNAFGFEYCQFMKNEDVIVLGGDNDGYVYQCDITGNYGVGVYATAAGAYITVRNTNITGNFGGITAAAGATIDYDYCNLFGNTLISSETGYINTSGDGTFIDGGHNISADPKYNNPGYNNKSYFVFTVDDSPNRPYAEAIQTVFDAQSKKFTWYFGPTRSIDPDSRWSAPSDTASGTAAQWTLAATLNTAGHDVGSHSRAHQRLAVDATGIGATIANAINIQYVGAGAACTLTIAADSLTTSVTGGPGGENLSLDLTNSSYDTLGELVAYINGLAAYTASLVTTTTEAPTDSVVLADVTDQDIMTAEYVCLFDATKLPDQEIGDDQAIPTKGAQKDFDDHTLLPQSYAYPYGFFNETTKGWVKDRGFQSARTTQAISNTTIHKWCLSGLNLFDIPVEFRTAADAWNIDTAEKGAIHGNFISFVGSCFPMIYTMLSHKTTEMPIDAVTSMLAALIINNKISVVSMAEAIAAIVTEGNSTDGWKVTKKIIPSYDFGLRSDSPCRDAGTPIAGLTTDIEGKPVPMGSAPDIGAYEFPVPSPMGLNLSLSGGGGRIPPRRRRR